MELVDGKANVIRSRNCFYTWFSRLRDTHARFGVYPDGEDLEPTQKVYEAFYKEYQHELGHYFRHLYHVFKFVDESPIENKKKYTSIVRAQLSAYEQALLFYNCVSRSGIARFKPLVERYALLENLPPDLLIMGRRHYDLYAQSAYGENAV
jgi:hypothetical protein